MLSTSWTLFCFGEIGQTNQICIPQLKYDENKNPFSLTLPTSTLSSSILWAGYQVRSSLFPKELSNQSKYKYRAPCLTADLFALWFFVFCVIYPFSFMDNVLFQQQFNMVLCCVRLLLDPLLCGRNVSVPVSFPIGGSAGCGRVSATWSGSLQVICTCLQREAMASPVANHRTNTGYS